MRFIGTWAVLVAVLFARRGWDELPSGNELTKLSFAQQAASPGWAKGDFAFEGQEPLYHHVYVKTSIVISRGKSVAWYAAALRIVNVLLFCAGFLALGRAIGLTDAGSIIAFVVYCGAFSLRHVLSWAGYLQLGGTGLVRVWADPDETAWGLALLACAAAVRSRWWLAAPLAGLATTVHVLVGLQLGVPLMAYGIYKAARGSKPVSRGVLLAAATLVPASPGLAAQFASGLGHPFSAAAKRIYFERNRHHLEMRQPEQYQQLAMAVVMLAGVLTLRGVTNDRRQNVDDWPIIVMLAAVGAYWALGRVWNLTDNYSLLRLYPFRTWAMVVIAGPLFLARAVRRLRTPSPESAGVRMNAMRWLAIVVTAVILSVVATRYRPGILVRSQRDVPFKAPFRYAQTTYLAAEPARVASLYEWIKKATPEGSVFLAPPEFWWPADFPWKTGRGLVYQTKAFPIAPIRLVEWAKAPRPPGSVLRDGCRRPRVLRAPHRDPGRPAAGLPDIP